mgnify:CR=1 FL=1
MLAVFLIVTLAAIGAYLVTISTGQVGAVVQDEQGARAYQAARSGIEWGAYQLLRGGDSCIAGPTTITLPQGFVANVECQLVASEMEGGLEVRVRKLTSTGCLTACGAVASPTDYREMIPVGGPGDDGSGAPARGADLGRDRLEQFGHRSRAISSDRIGIQFEQRRLRRALRSRSPS